MVGHLLGYEYCYLTCTVEITQYAQYALKGQKLLAQGIALGNDGCKPVAL